MAPRRNKSTVSATCRGVILGMALSYMLMSWLQGQTLINDETSHRHGMRSFASQRWLEEEEEQIDPDVEATAIVCIIILLIILTIAFEEVEELIEESSPRDFQPIVESLFGEMTVLGFLSVCTFCITKTPFPYILSRQVFGEEEFLVEIFEVVHFCLFFIMVFFVAQVLLLLKESIKTRKKWHAMDRACMEHHYGNASFQHHFNQNELQFFSALRNEFILERSPEPPFEPALKANQVSEDFNFGRYLSICLGITVSHVVHVDIISWIILIVLTVGFYLFMLALDGNLVTLAWIWAGIGWLDLILFTFVFETYLSNILKGLVPSTPAHNDLPSSAGESKTLLQSTTSLPAWCHVDMDEYMSKRSWLLRHICHDAPNRHDTFFWWEKKGPHVHFLVLQVNLVFLGIYGALLILTFIPALVSSDKSWLLLFVYLAVALVPALGIIYRIRHVVGIMSIVGSTGSLRRPQVVSDVIRKEKTLLVVRAFLVLDKMHTLAEENGEISVSPANEHTRELTHLEKMEVGATFDAFDRNGDGEMSIAELGRVMHSLGGETSETKLQRMLSSLDFNGDGKVIKEEFLEWYRRYMIPQEENVSMSDRAHALFHLFDKNNSGKITIGEFKRTIDTLNIGFTVDEVGQLVGELDEDGNIMIGLEEFHELLEKHYPEELEEDHS